MSRQEIERGGDVVKERAMQIVRDAIKTLVVVELCVVLTVLAVLVDLHTFNRQWVEGRKSNCGRYKGY